MVPANICYAAVLPILYSGNQPVFADVGEDGNLTCDAVTAVLKTEPRGAIIPHMYGNPCREISDICRALRARGAVVIEDCALAMGADIAGAMAGTFGDYAVYSFGYSKTIDCGYGGLIASQRNVDELAALNAELPFHTPGVDAELQLFSQVYRVLRNNPAGALTETVYAYARQRLQHGFLFRASPEHIDRLTASTSKLDLVIRQRRENVARYEACLNWSAGLKRYEFHTGAVPWRYNILVDAPRRSGLIAALLQQRLPVSDWYPVIAPMFEVNEPFPQALRMEKQLLNFPLVNVSEEQIERIAMVINSETSHE